MNTSLPKTVLSSFIRDSKKVPAEWLPLEKERLFVTRDKELIWKKYCGFLDLSTKEFMIMQKLLLMEQIELSMNSQLGISLIGDKKPQNINDFRRLIPLTTYGDYLASLNAKAERVLTENPILWIHSSGRTGPAKLVPISLKTLSGLADDALTALILSSAGKKGDVLLEEGARITFNLPSPDINEILRQAVSRRLHYRAIPSRESAGSPDLKERIDHSFRIALYSGLDYAGSLPAILAKVADNLDRMSGDFRIFSRWHPLAMLRLWKVRISSKLAKRSMLPRDLWKVKGLLCGGSDASLYRERIAYCWGVQPLEIYLSTETGIIAIQSWNKKGMTLIPNRNFYEFIPEKELIKCQNDPEYQPSTILLNELEAGKTYELVITNFHGGPFIRYRIGDLIKVVSLYDEETNIKLPQIVFYSRTAHPLQ